ncbi:putative lipid II flippase FtsW [bacterium]|nr:putative lipid II flippase FtsW [bacterium]
MKKRTTINENDSKADGVLFGIVMFLAIAGLITVYSAGSERSVSFYGSPHAIVIRQAIFLILGLGILFLTQKVPYQWWRFAALPGWILSVGLLAVVLIIGEVTNGAGRWIQLGPVKFQPSEAAKFATILFVAAWSSKNQDNLKDFRYGIAIPLAAALIPALMILRQPDLSTAFLLAMVAIALIFLSGAKLKHLVLVALPVLGGAVLAVIFKPYRLTRVKTILAGELDRYGDGYQLYQSWLGFGRGGLFGTGPYESYQKLRFLPDAHTDFIYSVIGEERGFIGAAIILVLFLIFIWRGYRISARCTDRFGSLLAAGITTVIGMYALINMTIATGKVPTTGLPLPFISYGGTSLVLTLASVGILLNISKFTSNGKIQSSNRGW